MLVDGGFASLDAIDSIETRGCTVYAPVKDAEKQKKAGKDPYARKPKDTDATAAWRKRMGEAASKVMYRSAGPDGGVGQRACAATGGFSRCRCAAGEMPDHGDAVRDHA